MSTLVIGISTTRKSFGCRGPNPRHATAAAASETVEIPWAGMGL